VQYALRLLHRPANSRFRTRAFDFRNCGRGQRLAASGVKEVTLLGQIVNLYGRHEFEKRNGQSPFVQLLEAVCSVGGIARVRFTSPHPIGFREDLLRAFGRLGNLVDHVHLPVQSGSDRILKVMRRGYTADFYVGLVEKLRQARPDCRHDRHHRGLSRRDGR
jgi:tRNA-2-methylthio-N6-dimethylallyladenosine synthase